MKHASTTFIVAAVTISTLTLPLVGADRKRGGGSSTTIAALSEQPTSTATAPSKSGFIVANDQTYLVQNGRTTPVTTQYMLRVSPAGIIGFDGRHVALPSGHMLSADGKIVPLPKDIKGLPAPAKAPPPPEQQFDPAEVLPD